VLPDLPDDARQPSEDRQRRQFQLLRIALGVIRLGPILMLVGLVVAMTLLSPVFFTTGNASNVLAQTAAIAVLAIGQLLVILTRGIDLSVGSTLALASVLGALAYAHGSPGIVVIIIMLAAGAAVGFVNGACTCGVACRTRFIITLARSASLVASPSRSRAAGQAWRARHRQVDRQLVVSQSAVRRVLVGAIGLLVAGVLARMVWGRWIYATGGNPRPLAAPASR